MKKYLSIPLAGLILALTVVSALGGVDWRDTSLTYTYLGFTKVLATNPLTASEPGVSSEPAADADIECFGDVTMADVDHISIQGNNYEADFTALNGGVRLSQGRFTLQAGAHIDDLIGKGFTGFTATGIDAAGAGISIMPGYRLWTQEENGVNVDVDGLLHLSYIDHKAKRGFTGETWHLTPGIRAVVNRMTHVGLFQVAYTFQSRRNLQKYKEFTGSAIIDGHGAAFDYINTISETWFGSAGISHIEFPDDGGYAAAEHRFTDLNFRVGTSIDEGISVQGGFSLAIDGRDTTRVHLHAVFGI